MKFLGVASGFLALVALASGEGRRGVELLGAMFVFFFVYVIQWTVAGDEERHAAHFVDASVDPDACGECGVAPGTNHLDWCSLGPLGSVIRPYGVIRPYDHEVEGDGED